MSAERAMKLDELILEYLIGHIGAEDLAVLDAWLRESPEARARFARLAEQEVDLRDATVMMADRRASRAPTRRSWAAWVAPMAAAASILVVAGLLWLQKPAGSGGIPVVVAAADGARVREVQAGVSVKRGDTTSVAVPGMALAMGDQVILKEATSRARIGWASEHTSLELEGAGTILRLDSGPGAAKALYLVRGQVRADVARQAAGLPMLLVTPSARATVVGTQFLLTSTEDSTELDVASGEIRLESMKGAVAQVGGGKAASVEAASGAISVLGRAVETYEFDDGFADWQVYTEDDERYVRPASPAMTNAVKLVEVTRDGRTVKCLEIDATATPGRWIHVRSLRRFNMKTLSTVIEYRAVGARNPAEVNMGMVVDAEAVEEKLLMRKPSSVGMNRWQIYRSDYLFDILPDGRPLARATNYIHGRSYHAKNSIFAKDTSMAHSAKASVRNMKVQVDRVVVREIDARVLPPADAM